MDLTQLFCDCDDFVKALGNIENPILAITLGKQRRGFPPQMSLAEMMTIIIRYHSSNFKNFKSFYLHLRQDMHQEFPKLLSYTRFVEWIPYCLLPITAFLKSRMGKITGISFIDSTTLSVCRNIRIPRNKVFKGIAQRGKSSMGWFFGFKLHIIVNEIGELLAFQITRGNTHDQVPVRSLCKGISGRLFGDKGYLGKKLFADLWQPR
jgi:hypothetical protein